MLGKILGGLIGARAAKQTRGVNEPSGALLGMASIALARRFGLPGIIAATAGGYALKKYSERKNTAARSPERTSSSR
jgi:NhaP-type Na+/H+ or K+/H+ antiporter